MKKLLLNTTLFCLITILILVILFFVNDFNSISYNYAYKKKIELMTNTPSPRIIVVGGSGAAFGIDSYYLEEKLNINVINTGFHAGLGMQFMLDDVLEYCKKGDVVLLMPEYSYFYNNGHLGGQIINDIVFSVDASKIKHIRKEDYITFISNIPAHIKSRILNTVKSLFIKNYHSVYLASSFNDKGDMVEHYNYPSKPFEQIYSYNESKFTDYIYEFIAQIHAIEDTGAKVILYPSALPVRSYKNIEKNITRITKLLEENKIRFISPPSKSCYHDSLFFDTPHHLNKQGVELRRTEIFEVLKEEINKIITI